MMSWAWGDSDFVSFYSKYLRRTTHVCRIVSLCYIDNRGCALKARSGERRGTLGPGLGPHRVVTVRTPHSDILYTCDQSAQEGFRKVIARLLSFGSSDHAQSNRPLTAPNHPCCL